MIWHYIQLWAAVTDIENNFNLSIVASPKRNLM
jgi:hypothetical protein